MQIIPPANKAIYTSSGLYKVDTGTKKISLSWIQADVVSNERFALSCYSSLFLMKHLDSLETENYRD